jgi:uncharacterized protein (DUF2141 family)
MKKFLLLLLISFGVLQLNAFTVTTTQTNVTCNGGCNGTATATPVGGVAPYAYVWNPGNPVTQSVSGLCAGNYTVTVTDATLATATATILITQPSAITIGMSATAATCGNQNGTASGNISGGTPPYTYQWNTTPVQVTATATGLASATYTLTVTDGAGCSVSNAIYVPNFAGPTLTLTPTNTSCNSVCDGMVSSTLTGGTPPYTCYWSPSNPPTPSLSNLCPGNYTLTVTDNLGCTVTSTAVVNQPAPVVVTVSPMSPTVCAGGSVTLTGSGAVTYQWFPGNLFGNSVTLTPTVTTTYTLMGTNAMGCNGTTTVTIYVNQGPTATISSIQNVSCYGGNDGSINSTPTGGTPPYSYLWNPSSSTFNNLSGLTAGSYTVMITDANGCVGSTFSTVTQPPQLVVTPGAITPAGCNMSDGNATVSATGGTGSYTYSWSPVSGFGASILNVPAGLYNAVVTDANGCTDNTNITITDSCDYVWPGDANDDAVADNLDILDIGIANSATGTTRANASLSWIGQPSTNWGQTLLSGTDYKFVDCNGDGSIDPNDTNAVIQNFGFTHNNRSGGAPVYNATLPDLTVTMGQTILASNSAGTMTISFGSSSVPVSNFYGLAFTLNFDPTQIDASTFRMNENGTWMGIPGSNLMGVVLNNGNGTGAVQIALTRLDHIDANGFGTIANLGFMTTSDLVGTGTMQNVNFTISDVTVIAANETPQTVNTVNDSIYVADPILLGVNETKINSIAAYPNPFNESVEIILPSSVNGKVCEVILTDATGRIVLSQKATNAGSVILQRGTLEAGIYFCSIRSEGQLIGNTKLTVN